MWINFFKLIILDQYVDSRSIKIYKEKSKGRGSDHFGGPLDWYIVMGPRISLTPNLLILSKPKHNQSEFDFHLGVTIMMGISVISL